MVSALCSSSGQGSRLCFYMQSVHMHMMTDEKLNLNSTCNAFSVTQQPSHSTASMHYKSGCDSKQLCGMCKKEQ